MLGVLVVTHSTLAEGLKNAVEMIMGLQEDFDFLCFKEGDDMLALSEKIKETTKKYRDKNEKFVVCVDLYGATPFNATAAGLAEFDVSVLTGVNLPMLMQILSDRDSIDDMDAYLSNVLNETKESMKVVKLKEMFS